MFKSIKMMFFLIGILLLSDQIVLGKGLNGPDDFSKKSQKNNFDLSLFSYPILFFKRYISIIDGNRCPMYPSCSTYALLCLKKHGALLGWLMAFDRLLHEPDEIFLSKLVCDKENCYSYDPVENNDFWWYKNR